MSLILYNQGGLLARFRASCVVLGQTMRSTMRSVLPGSSQLLPPPRAPFASPAVQQALRALPAQLPLPHRQSLEQAMRDAVSERTPEALQGGPVALYPSGPILARLYLDEMKRDYPAMYKLACRVGGGNPVRTAEAAVLMRHCGLTNVAALDAMCASAGLSTTFCTPAAEKARQVAVLRAMMGIAGFGRPCRRL